MNPKELYQFICCDYCSKSKIKTLCKQGWKTYYCSRNCQKAHRKEFKDRQVLLHRKRHEDLQLDIPQAAEDARCGICAATEVLMVLPGCLHTYCYECVLQWQRRGTGCPQCDDEMDMGVEELVLDRSRRFLLIADHEGAAAARELRSAALFEAERVLGVNPRHPQALLYKAMAMQKSDSNKALEILQSILDRERGADGDFSCYKKLTHQVRFERDEEKKAQLSNEMEDLMEQMTESLREDALLRKAHLGQAKIYEATGKSKHAISMFQTSVLLGPLADGQDSRLYMEALIGLARLSWNRMDKDQVLDLLQKAIAEDRSFPGTHLFLAQIQHEQGDLDSAVATLSRGILFESEESEESESFLLQLQSEVEKDKENGRFIRW